MNQLEQAIEAINRHRMRADAAEAQLATLQSKLAAREDALRSERDKNTRLIDEMRAVVATQDRVFTRCAERVAEVMQARDDDVAQFRAACEEALRLLSVARYERGAADHAAEVLRKALNTPPPAHG